MPMTFGIWILHRHPITLVESFRYYLTTANTSPWQSPLDWNNDDNTIEIIAAGGGGRSFLTGGGGGEYRRLTNFFVANPGTDTVNFNIGLGGAGGANGNSGANGTSTAWKTDALVAVGGHGGARISALVGYNLFYHLVLYKESGNLTISYPSHGKVANDLVYLAFQSGNLKTYNDASNTYNPDGIFKIKYVVDDDHFDVYASKNIPSSIDTWIKMHIDHPMGIYMKDDGKRFYAGTGTYENNRIFQLDLTIPFDLSTAKVNNSSLWGTGSAESIDFSSNGKFLYVLNTNAYIVTQYNLSEYWNVNTASQIATYNATPVAPTARNAKMRSDGNVLYLLSGTDYVYQIPLTETWNIATACTTYNQRLYVGTQDLEDRGLFFKPDGTIMYLCGWTNCCVYQYSLSEAWNVATSTYITRSMNLTSSLEEPTTHDISMSSDGSVLYVIGYDGAKIYQLPLLTPWNVNTAFYETSSNGSALIEPRVDSYNVCDSLVINCPSHKQIANNPVHLTFLSGNLNTTYDSDGWYKIKTVNNGDYFTVYSTKNISAATKPLGDLNDDAESPQHLYMKNDGTRVYVVGNWTERISQFDLTTPFDVTTIKFNSLAPFTANTLSSASIKTIDFSANGKYLYVFESDNLLTQYELAESWNINTASVYASFHTDVIGFMEGARLGANGNTLYLFDQGSYSDYVFQVGLGQTWNIATANTSEDRLINLCSISAVTNPWDIIFKPDGTIMYVTDPLGCGIFQYNLSQAWNVNTATYVTRSMNTEAHGIENNPRSCSISPDGNTLYLTGTSHGKIYQMPMSTAWKVNTASFEVYSTGNVLIERSDTNSYIGLGGSGGLGGMGYSGGNANTWWIASALAGQGGAGAGGLLGGGGAGGGGIIAAGGGGGGAGSGGHSGEIPIHASYNINSDNLIISYPSHGRSVNDPVYLTFQSGNIKFYNDLPFTYIPWERTAYFDPDGTYKVKNIIDSNNFIVYSKNMPAAKKTYPLTEITQSTSMYMNSDGTKLYLSGVQGASNEPIYQLDLTIPFDITSAVANTSTPAAITGWLKCIDFSSNGKFLYVFNASNWLITQYNLSQYWNVNTAIAVATYNVKPINSSTQGFRLGPNGGNLYLVSTGAPCYLYQMALSETWNVATANASYDKRRSLSSVHTTPSNIFFKPDGIQLYISDIAENAIIQWQFTDAWNVGGISIGDTQRSLNVKVAMGESEAGGFAFWINPNSDTLYVGGNWWSKIYQLPILSPWEINTAFYEGSTSGSALIEIGELPYGANGGNSYYDIGGGISKSATAASNGGGGYGGYGGELPTGGGIGGAGLEWVTVGSGGGGGGGGSDGNTIAMRGGDGGFYGGGGGGGGFAWIANAGGNGANGLIVVSYRPLPQTVIFLTAESASPWQSPADWNNDYNTIEAIAGGGGGRGTDVVGGGGGEYRKLTNFNITNPGTDTITFNIGLGGVGGAGVTDHIGGNGTNTTWNTASLIAVGGRGGWDGSGGEGGNNGVGGIGYHGGRANNWWIGAGGWGGGGAGGPHGPGANGGIGANNDYSLGGKGGGGGGGGYAGINIDVSITDDYGSNGGNSYTNTGGGLAYKGTGSTTAATRGGGGYGGCGLSGQQTDGGKGGDGTEWLTAGSGGGGGGGGAAGVGANGRVGGGGGLYGGGGGGGGWGTTGGAGGNGANGIIVISYLPKPKVIFLTTANTSPWQSPIDWNNDRNTIEVIGGGGGGRASDGQGFAVGGGGGEYRKLTNFNITNPGTDTVVFNVGLGGAGGIANGNNGTNGTNTTWNTNSLIAVRGRGGKFVDGGGQGGTGGTGGVGYQGGFANCTESFNGGSGGGGAGGPCGPGANGGGGWYSQGGAGGGGGGGGYVGGSVAGITIPDQTLGANGGNNYYNTGRGLANRAGSPVVAATGGGGGYGGDAYTFPKTDGGTGSDGIEWWGLKGSGGGGGGGGANGTGHATRGGDGGLYGAGGGGGPYQLYESGAGGNGANGLIVITYYPL